MDPYSTTNSYTNTIADPPKIGQYWDPSGEYEYRDTVYTISVYTPPRPPPRFLPKFMTREPVVASSIHIIRPSEGQSRYDCFELRHLDEMKVKVVKIKSRDFPADMRCKHVFEGSARKCDQGCYVLEKGGDISRWRCKDGDCEGHVYVGRVKKDCDEVACFGKKGERLVSIEK